MIGSALVDNGQGDKAVAIVQQALAERPDDDFLREAAELILTRGIPSFHRPMLADEARNDAYARAIARAASGRMVLDIGTGSGLLAMLAARAGARRVVACEANPALAATAREIVAANGLESVVEIVGRHSTKLEVDPDLGGPADLVITEIFGNDLVGEGALAAIADALGRLASDEAQIIPARAVVRIALASLDSAPRPRPAIVRGLDLSLFGRHSKRSFTVNTNNRALALRSAAGDLFRFDFRASQTLAAGRSSVALQSFGGRVDGIVQWLRLDLDRQTQFENAPGSDVASHWAAIFSPFTKSRDTAAGEEIRACGWHDQQHLLVWEAAA